ncbi:MAG: hypothetical protein DBY04_03510 [Clostridiales bacterium]|nr:MAG: hypothetical protein DBY04_03510 [Clostridiales bacterium]
MNSNDTLLSSDTKSIFQLLSQFRYKALEDFFEIIKDDTYVVLKGEVLSLLAYQKTGARKSSDIDILIPRKNLKKFENVLNSNGFSSEIVSRRDRILMLSHSHQVSPWIKRFGKRGYEVNVDLNFDLFWGEYQGKRIDVESFLSDTMEIDVFGIKVKSLTPIKTMIQIVLHHYKEMNSLYHLAFHNCINYSMFKDVYWLWKNNQTDISLNKLLELSSEYDINEFVFYIFYFTNQVFQDAMLSEYVEAFRSRKGERLLDSYGLSEKERKPWKCDFKHRIEADCMFDLIKDDLTNEDIEKIENNYRLFG